MKGYSKFDSGFGDGSCQIRDLAISISIALGGRARGVSS